MPAWLRAWWRLRGRPRRRPGRARTMRPAAWRRRRRRSRFFSSPRLLLYQQHELDACFNFAGLDLFAFEGDRIERQRWQCLQRADDEGLHARVIRLDRQRDAVAQEAGLGVQLRFVLRLVQRDAALNKAEYKTEL